MRNPTLLQCFHWYYPEGGKLWPELAERADGFNDIGINMVWLPPAYKGASGGYSVGYDSYDLFDLGEFDQKGSIPTQVLLGLALFLTFFIMSPVIDKIYVDAYQPFSEEKISMQEALEKGAQPLREFMLRQTREADLGLFARLANTGPLQGPEAVPMRILLPAYVTSELKTAFQIGFTIFIPFLIIDLVIASVLMALGMMMVPPATIALPFKLMLFVLVDGWQLLVGSLAQSFYS